MQEVERGIRENVRHTGDATNHRCKRFRRETRKAEGGVHTIKQDTDWLTERGIITSNC